uniref:DH domain-containing protein n=1 Tax=Ditylenchus dipsaci TaxID=166011 RepID=A0A915DS78_9BILA
MKRHLPRVLSSFRSSKRRIPQPNQVVVQQENSTKEEDELELARSGGDQARYGGYLRENLPFHNCHQQQEDVADMFLSEDDTTDLLVQENHSSNSAWKRSSNLSKRWKFGSKYNKECRAFDMRQIEVLHEFQSQHFCGPSSSSVEETMVADSFDQMSSSCSMTASSSSGSATKINYILEELLNTEHSYVKELESLVEFYLKPFEAVENTNTIPAHLRGQSDVIFGNLRELSFEKITILHHLTDGHEA